MNAHLKWLFLPVGIMGCADLTTGIESAPGPTTEASARRPATLARAEARTADGPSGTIALADTSGWTASRSVRLLIDASDDVTEMCISTRYRCDTWEKVTDQATVELTTGRQRSRIQATFRDAEGNESERASLTVYFDRSPPTGAPPTVTAGTGTVDLTWAPYVDAVSGMDHYFVVGAEGARAPRCTRGDVV